MPNPRHLVTESLHQGERFRLLLENIKDYAVFMLEPDGRVATWNRGAEDIKGYTAEEIIGQHFSRFYQLADIRAGKCQRLLDTASREGRVEDEGWRVRKDGTRFWADVVITAIRNPVGRLIGFAKVTRDLTERKRAEEQRIKLAQTEEAVRLRDEFLSIASHELKTPLTALQLQLESLQDASLSLDERTQRKIRLAARSGTRLAELIEMLLDVSRISVGNLTLDLQPVSLREAAEEVVERFRATAGKVGSIVTLHAPDQVIRGLWDRLRIEQVISNLLANALKYAAGTPVELVIDGDEREARVEVIDGGPGIPEAEAGRIFGRFERAASLRHYGGMGLGLYISRQIVEAHGGEITVQNRPQGGAAFSVRLPLFAPPTLPLEERH